MHADRNADRTGPSADDRMSTLEPKHAPHDGAKPDTKIDGSCTSSVRVGACVVCACMHVSARWCTVSPADRVVGREGVTARLWRYLVG